MPLGAANKLLDVAGVAHPPITREPNQSMRAGVMKKTLATATAVITGLLGVTLPATSATGAAPKCTVNAFTELREATAKTTATITPKDDRRIHHFVFVYSEMPVQEMRKARGRTTAIAFAAPIHVIAFRNGILCKTGSNVGIG